MMLLTVIIMVNMYIFIITMVHGTGLELDYSYIPTVTLTPELDILETVVGTQSRR